MLSTSILTPFRLTVAEKRLQVYGVQVYQAGEGSVTHHFRSDDRVCLYSGSKTFTSIACGIAADEGRLQLTDKLVDFFPEFREAASENTDTITLRDLLHMASGKEVFKYDDACQEDYLKLFLAEPMKWAAGSHFYYANLCTYAVGRVVEKLSGLTVRDYLAPRLFEPFGIHNAQWFTDPHGHTIAASGLFLQLDDFAKIGKLMLHGGEYEGKRIVSAEYVKAMYEDEMDTGNWGDIESSSGYGYQVWRCTYPGSYRADGMYGQFSIVIPDKQAVVTITSHQERAANDIIRAVFSDIVPLL